MVVDVHSHLFRVLGGVSDPFRSDSVRAHGGEFDLSVSHPAYAASAPEATRAVVVGGKARRSGLWVDDADVATHVAENPDHLMGYLSLDPTQPGWQDDLAHGHEDLHLRGIKLMPMYAGYDAGRTRAGRGLRLHGAAGAAPACPCRNDLRVHGPAEVGTSGARGRGRLATP